MRSIPTRSLEKAAGWEIPVLHAMAGAYVMCTAMCCRWQAMADIGNGKFGAACPTEGFKAELVLHLGLHQIAHEHAGGGTQCATIS